MSKRKKTVRGVSRIDQPEKHNHGWYVRLKRRGVGYSKFFSDKKNGGKVFALRAAKKYFKELQGKTKPLSRKERSGIVRRKGRSGIVGVARVIKKVNGVPYDFWQATWSPRVGCVKKTAFSVHKYGAATAKLMAIKARKKGLNSLE